jgi:hypothetical protein
MATTFKGNAILREATFKREATLKVMPTQVQPLKLRSNPQFAPISDSAPLQPQRRRTREEATQSAPPTRAMLLKPGGLDQ